jgi:hypothetical protein
MTYWNDPFHFSLAMGRSMLAGLVGVPGSGQPGNFMQRLTPESAASYIERRRRAARQWADANPAFVTRFEHARQKWLAAKTKAN